MILEKDDEIISVASIRYDIITIFFLLGLFDLICWPLIQKVCAFASLKMDLNSFNMFAAC